jgi:hypothetical protein
VPDPAAGTVYVSPVMPIGPVPERAGYGAEFAAHLAKQGKLSGQAEGYCLMRPSQEAVARAQALLPKEACRECGGASRFEPVAWPRGGQPSPPLAVGLGAPAPSAGPTTGSAAAEPPFPPTLVVMGNARTGRIVTVGNRTSAQAVAQLQARFPAAEGWKSLLTSLEPGFGAVVCVPEPEGIRFFVAHAQPSQEQAVLRAGEFALQSADDPSGMALCGHTWRVYPPLQGGELSKDTAIDHLKQLIRGMVTCDPARGPCRPKTPMGEMGARG